MSFRHVVVAVLVIGVLCRPAAGQQAQQLTACRLDGGAGCSPLTTSTGVSATLDLITSTRGSIFYRGASGWVGLAPGTAGMFLRTQGAGADPLWSATAARTDTGNTFTGDQSFGGKFTAYNGLTTEGLGVSPIVKVINLTGQTAAIGTTNVLASVPAGLYSFVSSIIITTAATSGNISGNVSWTDVSGVGTLQGFGAVTVTPAGNRSGNQSLMNVQGSSTITYTTIFNSVVGTPTYSFYLVLVRLL